MSAVSLYHFGNENLEGALSCHRKAGGAVRPAPRPLSGLRCLAIRGRDGGFLPRPVRRAYPLDPGIAKQTPPHHSIEGVGSDPSGGGDTVDRPVESVSFNRFPAGVPDEMLDFRAGQAKGESEPRPL